MRYFSSEPVGYHATEIALMHTLRVSSITKTMVSRELVGVLVVLATITIANTAIATPIAFEITTNEGLTGSFTLDRDRGVTSGSQVVYSFDADPAAFLEMTFSHPGDGNDYNLEDSVNGCCHSFRTDLDGNLLSIRVDIDNTGGGFLFGELSFTTGQGFFATGSSGGEQPFTGAVAVSAVPEPGTVALLGLGCLGMGAAALRRRRKSKAAA